MRTFFGGGAIPQGGHIPVSQFLGLLWSYWMGEAASDVYGAMNIGPGFGLNLVAFFAAMWERKRPTGKPTLRTFSGADQSGRLDSHPTDILRPYLIMGATEALQALSPSQREEYSQDLQTLAQITASGATTVEIQGRIPVGPSASYGTSNEPVKSPAPQPSPTCRSAMIAAVWSNWPGRPSAHPSSGSPPPALPSPKPPENSTAASDSTSRHWTCSP